MKATREDVVQAALLVERWCAEHWKDNHDCDCPFNNLNGIGFGHCAVWHGTPHIWRLEEYLRTRGLKDGEV